MIYQNALKKGKKVMFLNFLHVDKIINCQSVEHWDQNVSKSGKQ